MFAGPLSRARSSCNPDLVHNMPRPRPAPNPLPLLAGISLFPIFKPPAYSGRVARPACCFKGDRECGSRPHAGRRRRRGPRARRPLTDYRPDDRRFLRKK
ncbi:hypothetical protein EVAR_93058_1 [Eumeta japonica]|uniref:Uncharacterized protein n=1 Tax=Eumeta variegata TaxID=151549 RepID=A0A4C1TI26_EUMVA|nr:hypothetical protein EVAR_93058_1 [Eumeta japonica]